MSNSELERLQKELSEIQGKIAAVKAAEKSAQIETIKKLIAQYDITASEIGFKSGKRGSPSVGATRKKSDVDVDAVISEARAAGKKVYRNGSSYYIEGSRGKKPNWMAENPEQYLI